MRKPHFHRTAPLVALALGIFAGPAALAAVRGELVVRGEDGITIVPSSSLARPEDQGIRAHTNVRIFVPNGWNEAGKVRPAGKYETPASLACLYGVTKLVKGCNPETLTTVATGGSKVVAIVEAYDYPKAAKDLSVFSKQFGLPAISDNNFQVVYASGTRPQRDPTGGWELEEALGIEMAHALAPNAEVVLVEATSRGHKDLMKAESVAGRLVAAAGGGEVSSSWTGAEWSTEDSTKGKFLMRSVVFVAAAGDTSGVSWPSVLPNVVAVGGTVVNRDKDGNLIDQSAWSDTGGGASAYIPRPSYQDRIKKIVGSWRGVPDISLVAAPSTGVWIYDTDKYGGQELGWLVVGGTGAAAPASAALVNNAAHFFVSSKSELAQIYAATRRAKDFIDIKKGHCGANGQQTDAVPGWDYCTGVGTPFGTANK